MDTVKEGIRRNLVELLAMSGKRNVDLAEACGVGKSAVSNWLSGKTSIDIERIPAICDFLGVTVDEFFGRANAMRPEPELSPDEKELVVLFRNMSPDMQRTLLETARNFAALRGVDEHDRERDVRDVLIG